MISLIIVKLMYLRSLNGSFWHFNKSNCHSNLSIWPWYRIMSSFTKEVHGKYPNIRLLTHSQPSMSDISRPATACNRPFSSCRCSTYEANKTQLVTNGNSLHSISISLMRPECRLGLSLYRKLRLCVSWQTNRFYFGEAEEFRVCTSNIRFLVFNVHEIRNFL